MATTTTETRLEHLSLYRFGLTIHSICCWYTAQYYTRWVLYLRGLCEGVLCAFGEGAQVSTIDYSETSQGRDNQKHKAC